MFICGSGSFVNQDEEKNETYSSPCQTPKRSKRQKSFRKIIGRDNGNKNPYADRGLEKFNALLADLDNKKQQIYTQINPEEISFIRFVYTNDSEQVEPIVLRVKDKNKQPKPNRTFVEQLAGTNTQRPNRNSIKQLAATTVTDVQGNNQTVISQSNEVLQIKEKKEQPRKKKRCLRFNGSFTMENLKRPSFYVPAMILLILLFLCINGRIFAILCTSIGWYLIPTVIGGSSSSPSSSSLSNSKKLKRKKEYVKKLSEIKIERSDGSPSSPTSVLVHGMTDKKNRQQGQRRS